jgi:hypothetical protein
VTHNPGHSESVRDKDDDVDVIELKGSGSAEEEYRPKAVNRNLVKGMSLMKQQQAHNDTGGASKTTQNMNALSRVLFAVFGGRNQQSTTFNEEGAKKVDPKLFFANERTFLKWMNVSVWVAGISIGLSSIGGATPGGLESVSGLFFLAVAIVLVCYSMYQCKYSGIDFMVDVQADNENLLLFGNSSDSILVFLVSRRRKTVSFGRKAITRPVRRPMGSSCHWVALCACIHGPVLYSYGLNDSHTITVHRHRGAVCACIAIANLWGNLESYATIV